MPKISGYRYFAEAMQRLDVTHLFFVPTIITRAMAEMEDMGIRRVSTHGEKAAAYMADGYARALHKPSFCLSQNIGAANLAAGLRDAYLAGSPVIAVTGGYDRQYAYRHVYQQIDDFPMFDPVTKLNMQVDSVSSLPEILRQALRTATTGAPGPVHLRLQGRHGNVLEGEADVELFLEDEYMRCPAVRPQPEPDSVHQAVSCLLEAQRPVIVAGGGVITSGAADEVVELAERLSIPVATSLNAKATLPDDHPLAVGVVGTYSRWCANRIVCEADLVFFIGSHTSSQVTNHWNVPRAGTPVVQLDIDPAEIGRSCPVRVGLVGDAKATLRMLIDVIDGVDRDEGSRKAWLVRAQELVSKWRAEVADLLSSDAVPMRPERICAELTEALPGDAVVVADTGHSGIWTGTMLGLTKEDQQYLRCAGSLGWAFPASLGVKCALPDRPVLCFTGDGGFAYHLAELETAARFGINTVVLVNNNHALGQEQRQFNAAYGGEQRGMAHEMWVYREVNYAAIAEEMGCLGIRVERPGDIRAALDRAFSANRPTVIDVVTDMWALAARPWG